MATSTIDDAVAACTAISIECAVRNSRPLAYHDEFQAATDAATVVSA